MSQTQYLEVIFLLLGQKYFDVEHGKIKKTLVKILLDLK